jgi:Xaa-Pro aminopeptidase
VSFDVPVSSRGAAISQTELERRWTAVRAAMRRDGVDALVMQHNNPASGYLRYFTDLIPGGNPTSVVFAVEQPMTVIRHGAIDGDRDLSDSPDPTMPGVGRVRTTPHFNAASYTTTYDAGLVADTLAEHGHGLIGLLGLGEMSHAFARSLHDRLPDASFCDYSEAVDRVKVVKSPEELLWVRETAALQDEVMQVALESVAAGVRERDVTAAMVAFSTQRGSDYGTYMLGSAAPGAPTPPHPIHLQNRVIERGDVVCVLIENTGPGGYYTELGRTVSVGSAPGELVDELAFAELAQQETLRRLIPGTPCAEVWEAYNAFMIEHGRAPETRIHCHGQGYDLVERPLVRFDETMSVAPNMNVACHPAYARNGFWSWICDNYIIEADGPGACLHQTPRQIFEV